MYDAFDPQRKRNILPKGKSSGRNVTTVMSREVSSEQKLTPLVFCTFAVPSKCCALPGLVSLGKSSSPAGSVVKELLLLLYCVSGDLADLWLIYSSVLGAGGITLDFTASTTFLDSAHKTVGVLLFALIMLLTD